MNLKQAKELIKGNYVLYKPAALSKPRRYKITSVKTWKTRPAEIKIGLKYGLYSYDTANQDDLELLTKE